MLSVDSPFIRRAHRADPAVRLFCIPYAGGGASIFGGWPDLLPDHVEMAAVQLPGREDRSREPVFREHLPLVRTLAHAIRPYLAQPFALFGHCTGALLAFEVAVELRRRFGAQPAHLFVSGQAAAAVPARHEPIHEQSEEEFRESVGRMQGAPSEVLADGELMDFLSRLLRADFRLWERYVYAEREPLDCPITAFTGLGDPRTAMADVAEWERHTTSRFRLHAIEGGHFFINDEAKTLTREIVSDLAGRPGE